MTKQDLIQSEAWQNLLPSAQLRLYGVQLHNVHREKYPCKRNADREAIILRGSPLGIHIDFMDRAELEATSAFYHAPADSLIIVRKDGNNYEPKYIKAVKGNIVLM